MAGLSMGGLGAMAYAARHPGMFRAAASYSGLLHTRYDGAPSPGFLIVQNLLGTYPQSLAFVDRLRQLAIPVRFDDYSPGTHDWPYWERELRRSLPLLLDALRRPAG